MQVLLNAMVVIIWPRVSALNQHSVRFRTPTVLYTSDLSVNLGEKKRRCCLISALERPFLSLIPTPQQASSPSSTPGSLRQSLTTGPRQELRTKMKSALSTDAGDRRWTSGQVISAQLTPPAMLSFLVCVLVETGCVCGGGWGWGASVIMSLGPAQ